MFSQGGETPPLLLYINRSRTETGNGYTITSHEKHPQSRSFGIEGATKVLCDCKGLRVHKGNFIGGIEFRSVPYFLCVLIYTGVLTDAPGIKMGSGLVKRSASGGKYHNYHTQRYQRHTNSYSTVGDNTNSELI